MTAMAHHINEMKRRHEHAVRVQEVQSQLEDYSGEDLTRLGDLVLEVSYWGFIYTIPSHLSLSYFCVSQVFFFKYLSLYMIFSSAKLACLSLLHRKV